MKPVGLLPEGQVSVRGAIPIDALQHQLHETFARGPILLKESRCLIEHAHRLIIRTQGLRVQQTDLLAAYPSLRGYRADMRRGRDHSG